jgi:hypothetical protein
VKISLRFVSWLDILDIPACSIPYILFKLKEIKKDEVISIGLHAIFAVCYRMYSHPFSLLLSNLSVSYYYLKELFACFTNIGAIGTDKSPFNLSTKHSPNTFGALQPPDSYRDGQVSF